MKRLFTCIFRYTYLNALQNRDATSSDLNTGDRCYNERYYNMIVVSVFHPRSSTVTESNLTLRVHKSDDVRAFWYSMKKDIPQRDMFYVQLFIKKSSQFAINPISILSSGYWCSPVSMSTSMMWVDKEVIAFFSKIPFLIC